MTLDELATSMQGCQDCGLGIGRKRLVFGQGNPAADLMLVGEGPGAQEDEQGIPFVGAAGQLLDKILLAAGINREEVFIGNVIKCRPPGNRLPNPDEVAACLPYLDAQIALIRPRVIVCLGSLASRTLVDPKLAITKARGQWRDRSGIMVMPTFHPAALLRDPGKKRPVWEDFQKIRDYYRNGTL